MIVRTIEILLEYICLMLCSYTIAKKEIKVNNKIVLLFISELIIMQAIACGIVEQQFKLLVHCLLFIYVRKELAKTWNNTIRIYGIMLIVLMILQIVGYYIIRIFLNKMVDTDYTGTIINLFACIIVYMWRTHYNKLVDEKINSKKYIIIILIFLIVLFRIINLCIRDNLVDFEIVVQFCLESIGLCVASILWINAENENKHKIKEIQMYELYNNAFEETVHTIRVRQHEFENHINAIKCMQYTISNPEQLMIAQEEYCNEILRENEMNRLLKIKIDPIIAGFLYSKIMSAKEKEIVVKYNVNCIYVKKYIPIYELIETIGILFDNAAEAILDENIKIIIVNLLETDEEDLCLEIANNSRIYKNNEIEKFCNYGYSTKGQKRGVGLVRVKEIVEKNKAELLIQNKYYEDANYLSFQIVYKKMKKELY